MKYRNTIRKVHSDFSNIRIKNYADIFSKVLRNCWADLGYVKSALRCLSLIDHKNHNHKPESL